MSAAPVPDLADLKEISRTILQAALDAADPGRAVRAALDAAPVQPGPGGRQEGRLFLLAVGKASLRMAAAVDLPVHSGLVVQPSSYPGSLPSGSPLRLLGAAHPVPDEGSAAAARAALELVDSMDARDLCLFLLSGGGSSLLSLPHAGLTLDDLAAVNRLLLHSGAGIEEINTVRRHLSAISGGRLAARCKGSLATLAVSDVAGDDLSAIASGPGVPDPTTFADARRVLEGRGLWTRLPAAVAAHLEAGCSGEIADTPKQLPFRHVARVIASGRQALAAAAAAARRAGYQPRILTDRLEGEAREAGRWIAAAALDLRRRAPRERACLLAAGETTVTIKGTGRGGRNQEIALAAAGALEGATGILLTSFATDGIEGNTGAAGAHASGFTLAAGRAEGLDPDDCLARNDSHAFLAAAGELVVTGPTGTNVNDLTWVLVGAEGDAP